MKSPISIIILVSFITSCGHLANPAPPKVELTSTKDQSYSCEEINTEILDLQTKRVNTQKQINNQKAQNILSGIGGWLVIVPYIFIDVTTDKNAAYNSYAEREEYLRELATNNNCTNLPMPYEFPSPQKQSTFIPSGGNVVQSKLDLKETTDFIPEPIKASPIKPSPSKTALSETGPIEPTASIPTSKETVSSITNPKEFSESIPKNREKLALLPTFSSMAFGGAGMFGGPETKTATTKAISKELLKISYIEVVFSYYDISEYHKAKRIPDDFINENNVEEFFIKEKPDMISMSKLGKLLGVDYVCGSIIRYPKSSSQEVTVSIYVIDVNRKRFVKEDYELIGFGAFNQVGSIARKFFDDFNVTYIGWKNG